MPSNLIVRMGLDLSRFYAGLKNIPKAAESVSKKVKKSLSQYTVSQNVGNAMGWSGNVSDSVAPVNATNYAQARQQLADLTAYRQQLENIGFDANSTDTQYGVVSERIRELTYDIRAYEDELQRQATVQQQAASAADQAAAAHRDEAEAAEESTDTTRRSVSPLRSLGQWLRSIGSHVPGIRKTSDEVGKIGKRSKSSSLDIGRMVSSLRRVALVSFAFRLAGAAMGRLRSIVGEYISENAILQAQVDGLKAGMGQALAPAINLVVNAMSGLLPYVIGVSNAIGQLMGALFGTGWTTAATGAQKTAAATGSAAKAQKELNRQLLSFDEINKLNADNDSAASGGGGGGGSSITPIEAKTPAWLERFKTTFSDLFNSDEFKAANIGGKIGMSLQSGLDWLGNEGKAFDWRGVGKNLRENFDSFMGSGWVESLSYSVGIYLGGFADMVIGLLGPQWGELRTAYQNEGWQGATAYILGMGAALAFDVIGGLFTKILSPMFVGVADFFREHGNYSIAGFFDGCAQAMANVGAWIKENITDPIVNYIRNLLGIHSPSTVFASIGEDCMAGLGNGFSSGIAAVLQKLSDLRDRVFDTAGRIKEAFSFEWRMPHLRLPHLSVAWDPVDNVLAQFFGVTAFPRLSVSWFAKGGVLNGAQIFGRMGSTLLGGGEAGKEAILPLEQNTWWMDKIADRVVSRLAGQNGGDINATIYLTLDGEVLNRVVIKGLRKYARANGGLGFN